MIIFLGIMICLIISFVIFFKPTLTDKKTDIEFDSYNHIWENELENWSILTSFSELKILKKYAGELRMGPGFFHIKTESNNIFGKEFYGDWFYRIENGIYLQKWNSNPIKNGIRTKADNDLIFYDRIKNEIRIIETGIESFHWKMEKDELGLSLISNNGKTEERIRITNANNGYN